MRVLNVLLIWMALILVASDAATAQQVSGHRKALLIGNAKYDGFTLPGVGKSLDALEVALQQQGFEVIRHENLDEKKLKEVAESFPQSVPTNGVALIYYQGLGANVTRLGKRYNLLRPIGVSIKNEGDYRSRALSLDKLLELLREKSGATRSLVLLDACWQSPVKIDRPDNIQAGLSEFETQAGEVVMFAAGSGKSIPAPAKDVPSPMAQAITKHLAKFNASSADACTTIANDLNQAWFAAGDKAGIGAPSRFPVANKLRDGKAPGEGFVNSIGMTFRWCPPGKFTMGSRESDNSATRDRQPVDVVLTQGFWMGEHEVTQREHYAVTRKNPPRGFTESTNTPYWGVTESKHITDFCKKLTEIERKAGRLPDGWMYVAPTEAEWEYACRAGASTRFCFGDDAALLGKYGNFADRTLWSSNPDYNWADRKSADGVAEALAPVGSYLPNAWGIRDMHGNVAEIVADHLVTPRKGGTDPLVRLEKNGVTQTRGGAWCSVPLYCESSFRNALTSRDKLNFVGFRIAIKKVK